MVGQIIHEDGRITDMTSDMVLDEMLRRWSVGDCASMFDYIYSLPTPEQVAYYAAKVALAIQALDPEETNQADLEHFMDLLEG